MLALQAGLLWHPAGMTPWIDVLSPAIVIAVVVLLWRQTNGRLDALTTTVTEPSLATSAQRSALTSLRASPP